MTDQMSKHRLQAFQSDLALTNPADPNAVPTGKEADAFRRLAFTCGLAPSYLGRTFRSQGVEHRIIGLKPRASTRPILTQASDGRRYAFSVDVVTALLHRQAA
jgi:hypothetical protein